MDLFFFISKGSGLLERKSKLTRKKGKPTCYTHGTIEQRDCPKLQGDLQMTLHRDRDDRNGDGVNDSRGNE